MRILVVDDDRAVRESLRRSLTFNGYSVELAQDGVEALERISSDRPDAVVLDDMMPRLDGYQTCALIKKNPRLKATPVIMLSSKDGLFDRARGRLAGSDEYLTKPFTKESLLRSVASHTQSRQLSALD